MPRPPERPERPGPSRDQRRRCDWVSRWLPFPRGLVGHGPLSPGMTSALHRALDGEVGLGEGSRYAVPFHRPGLERPGEPGAAELAAVGTIALQGSVGGEVVVPDVLDSARGRDRDEVGTLGLPPAARVGVSGAVAALTTDRPRTGDLVAAQLARTGDRAGLPVGRPRTRTRGVRQPGRDRQVDLGGTGDALRPPGGRTDGQQAGAQ